MNTAMKPSAYTQVNVAENMEKPQTNLTTGALLKAQEDLISNLFETFLACCNALDPVLFPEHLSSTVENIPAKATVIDSPLNLKLLDSNTRLAQLTAQIAEVTQRIAL